MGGSLIPAVLSQATQLPMFSVSVRNRHNYIEYKRFSYRIFSISLPMALCQASSVAVDAHV